MYKHFVITRFNIPSFPTDKFGRKTLTDEWMLDRFELFEKYCVPSLLNQSTKDFKWLVLFDIDTSSKFKEKIFSYNKLIPFFVPLFVSNIKDLQDFIYDNISISDSYILTTRIDNDDSIHKDFLIQTQTLFNKQYNCFIRYNCGYQWIVKDNILLNFYEKSGNHFTTRVECIKKGIDTVMSCDGSKIAEIEDVEIIDIDDQKKRLWIEVIHEKNVANHIRILFPRFNNRIIKQFNLELRINKRNTIIMLMNHYKKCLYELFAFLFNKIGMLEIYKKTIRLLKF